MKKISLILLTLPLATVLSFAYFTTVTAQITPDNSLGADNSVVTPNAQINNVPNNVPSDRIDGGATRGTNLFHSFQEFNVNPNRGAYFNNPQGIANILTRVTGGNPSNIQGVLGVLGNANLFFINPNGIIFGRNARLDLRGGSFLGSTANSLRFQNGLEFSATNPQAPPLLTINVPIGLGFRDNPQSSITNQSRAQDVNGNVVGLAVESRKSLALVGGNVNLENGGRLRAPNGRIELGSVDGDSFVSLREINTGYELGYENVQKFRDIQLSGRALVDTSGDGGGDIQVQGKNITLTGNSFIFSTAQGSQPGGKVTIKAAESVKLSGGSQIITFAQGGGKAGDVSVTASNSVDLQGTTSSGLPTFIGSKVCSSQPCGSVTGNGGNVTIDTGKLFVRDGANVDASTFGVGNAGNILIKASDSVDVTRTNSNGRQSAIRAQAEVSQINNPGNAGNITIETQRLTVQNGAQISTAGRSTGKAGDLTINATDSISLSGFSPSATSDPNDTNRSGIFVSAEPGASGNVGSLNLTTGKLTVENGAKISADNFGSGSSPGSSTLNVRQLVIQDGGQVRSGSFAGGNGGDLTVNATGSVDVVGTGTIKGEPITSTLFSQASDKSSGNAGNLIINTPNLNVRDRAEVTVSSKGTGAAGNLTTNVDTIHLNGGKLTAEIKAGGEGNIEIKNLGLLLMENGSLISAKASEDANGGNITINTPNAPKGLVVAFPGENNDIVADAKLGNGGNIKINATSIFGLEERKSTPINTTNDIDASSQFGSQGTVIINTPDVDPSRGLFKLFEYVIDPAQLIAQNPCIKGFGSSFTITGRGGLPTDPNKILSSDNVRVDLIQPVVNQKNSSSETHNQSSTSAKAKPKVKEIIPARGWIFNDKGQVVLVGYDPTQTGIQRSQPKPPACPAF